MTMIYWVAATASALLLNAEPQSAPPATECSVAGFTPNPIEHVVNYRRDAIEVRSVQGTLTSVGGRRPIDVSVRFEIRGPGSSGNVRRAVADREGRFTMDNVPPGSYCFRASAIGWQSVVGRITVAPTGPRRTIELTLLLGV